MDSEQYDEHGRQLFLNGRYEEALEAFREGVRRFPNDEDLMLGVGMCQARLGNVIPAVETFEALRAKHPGWGDVLLGLTDAYLKLGRVTAAVKTSEEATRDESDGAFVHEVARLFFDHRRYVHAERLYRKATQLDRKFPPAHLGLGACMHKLGRIAEAEAEIREAIRLDPEYWPAYQYLGNLLYEQDRKEEAREALDRVPLDTTWHRLALERLASLSPKDRPKRRTLEAMLRRSPRRAPRSVKDMLAQREKRFYERKSPPKEGPAE